MITILNKLLNKNFIISFVLLTVVPSRIIFANDALLSNWTNSETLVQFLTIILDSVIKIGALVVVMLVVYSGFLFVTAQGNDEKLKEAKDSIFWVLIGAAIILGAWAVENVVVNTIDTVLP